MRLKDANISATEVLIESSVRRAQSVNTMCVKITARLCVAIVFYSHREENTFALTNCEKFQLL